MCLANMHDKFSSKINTGIVKDDCDDNNINGKDSYTRYVVDDNSNTYYIITYPV